MSKKYEFDVKTEEKALLEIINQIANLENPTEDELQRIFRKNPRNNSGLFKKSDILYAYEQLKVNFPIEKDEKLRINLRMKDTRTISGVTPVTVLTKPFPCPGKCIFCPNDVRMPKSYLSDEPGAQRATRNKFDPYAQTFNRLLAYKAIGHSTDKVELIILGGTWTSYPETYQIWYVKRCFDAMNDFHNATLNSTIELEEKERPFDEKSLEEIDGEKLEKSYNQIISMALLPKREQAKAETATWEELFDAQKINEASKSRCVGLVIETRPDEINEEEVIRIRKLGATKVQIGFQSLNDEVLEKNKRGHNVETTRKAVQLLRLAGFKIHAHWMPNLYGSNPEADVKDYEKIFNDPDFKPDEMKVYPCSLIASAELMQYYKNGLWKPYTSEELLKVLEATYKLTPAYCRITRMIRDIGSQDIVVGNKKTNLREVVENRLHDEGFKPQEIRSREIKDKNVKFEDLKMEVVEYDTSVSKELFIQYVTAKNEIAGFLRLSLPTKERFMDELKDTAMIREVHVYGQSLQIGDQKEGKAQHLGLGKKLISKAEDFAKSYNFDNLAVISSIGTREYYSKQGYSLNYLYQIKKL
jgi:elongator complex protein 3